MTTNTPGQPDITLQEFIRELGEFARVAEENLVIIDKSPEANKGLFSVFTEQMFKIRGTSLQLSLPNIARIAGLGEELSIKAATASTRPQIRKCTGALWDALTTVKYLLQNRSGLTAASPTQAEDQQDTQNILVNRLEKTLQSFGGRRPTLNAEEIAELIRKKV